MKKDLRAIIDTYIRQLETLLKSKHYSFKTTDKKTIPKGNGIYGIFRRRSGLIYIGISKNIRRRIFGDHLTGDVKGSAFRKNLSQDRKRKSKRTTPRAITDYIAKNCTFRFMKLNNPKYLEHFAISVLKPKLNR